MKKVMIVGASGFLGREIAHTLWKAHYNIQCLYSTKPAPFPWQWHHYVFPRHTLSVVLQKHNPDVLVLSATLTRDTNSHGSSMSLAEFEKAFLKLIQQSGDRRIVLTSTDAVFDGKKGQYTEDDSTNPLSEHGKKSVIAENILANYSHNFLIMRMSYLSGYSLGQLNRRWQRLSTELTHGRPLAFSCNVFKSPIEVQTAAQHIANATQTATQGIVHLVEKRLSVYDYYHQGIEHLQLMRYKHLLCIEDAPYCLDTSLSTIRTNDTTPTNTMLQT